MAIYEYYCPTCRDTFERRRPMAEAAAAATCASGHRAERAISTFAVARGGNGAGSAQFEPAPMPGGGCACGGGGCGCSS